MNKFLQGDALAVLKTLPSESVNCVITSPPYWNLRNYGIDGQLGLEKTFQEYISKLCDIFDEVKRVLRKDGTCFVNLGDTYGGSWQDYGSRGGGQREKNTISFERKGNPSDSIPGSARMPAKSLCLIPERFAIEMVSRGWILRNKIVWYKRNCMPSSASDRFTVDFEDVFFFVKSKRYWFEQQFEKLNIVGVKKIKFGGNKGCPDNPTYSGNEYDSDNLTHGRNMRCVWDIPTSPFKGAHFAVFPEALVLPMMRAGCPEFVCEKCGEAREKIYESEFTDHDSESRTAYDTKKSSAGRLALLRQAAREQGGEYVSSKKFGGLSDCGCSAPFRSGVVIDPFAGSGTVGVVAKKLGRDFIGIELNSEYVKMAEERLAQVPERLL